MARSIPEDFVEMRHKIGSTRNLAKHYRASERTIKRWLNEAGLPRIKTIPPSQKIPIPDCFKMRAQSMNISQHAAFYGVSTNTISRWAVESGVKCKVNKIAGMRLSKLARDIPQAKKETPHDLAVNYLQKYMPVNRCDKDGKWHLNGSYYRVGNTVINGDELLAKAEARRHRDASKKAG